jgi:hypothetical protein
MKILSITFTHAARFDITNNCPFTVWAEAVFGRGRQLNQGETWDLDVNAGTAGVAFGLEHGVVSMVPDMVVARPVSAMGFSNAKPIYGVPPNTLAEFGLNQFNNLDFFDISLVDGFNVAMDFSPTSNGYTRGIRCTVDINRQCPNVLKASSGCNNPCTMFKTNQILLQFWKLWTYRLFQIF